MLVTYTDGSQESLGKIAVAPGAPPDESTIERLVKKYIDANADKFKGQKGDPGQPGESIKGPIPVYLLGKDDSGKWQQIDQTETSGEPVAVDIFDVNQRLQQLRNQ